MNNYVKWWIARLGVLPVVYITYAKGALLGALVYYLITR